MRITKKIVAAFMCGTVAVSSLTGCGFHPSRVLMGRLSKTEVFRIGDNICTKPELMVYLTTAQKQYENILGVDMWDRDFGGVTLESYLKETILGQIAQVKSMTLLAEEYKVTLNSEEENKVNEAAKKYYDSLNKAEKSYLGVDQEVIATLYREYALSNKVYDEITKNVDTEVSDDEARKITVQMICFKFDTSADNIKKSKKESHQKAKEVLTQVRGKNTDFASVAEQKSEEETIEYTFGKGEQEEAVEIAAFNLDTNEISDIIETKDAYVIMKCISNFDREQTDANKAEIVEKRKKEAFDTVYDEFIKKAPSQFNDELWEEISFTEDENIENMSFFEVYNEVFEK